MTPHYKGIRGGLMSKYFERNAESHVCLQIIGYNSSFFVILGGSMMFDKLLFGLIGIGVV